MHPSFCASFLFISVATAFTSIRNEIPTTSLQSSLGDDIRASQSIFDNISYTSRSSSHNPSNANEQNSGYAPISQSTGQVGTYGVIGETFDRNTPIDYNSRKSSKPAFVPHSSTGAGNAPMSVNSPYRRAPTDYNACKSFTVSQDELNYFRDGVKDVQFPTHSSTGAADSNNSALQYRHVPTDYNSSKSISISHNEITHYQNNNQMDQITTSNVQIKNGENNLVDLNSKAAPFVPHSSTGAGDGVMSNNSPLYQNGRY